MQCGGTDRVSAAASLQCSILVPLSFVLLSYASCVVDQIMSDMKNDVINTECMFNAHYKRVYSTGRTLAGRGAFVAHSYELAHQY